MVDFAHARRTMVDGQIRTADVTDLRVLGAFQSVAREQFVPEKRRAIAYLDCDVPVADGRALIKPMVLAKLIQAAGVTESDCVLDAGCATGYSSAVLAALAASVVALEEDAALAAQAKRALSGAGNTTVVTGALTAGWQQGAPYDVIVLQGATEVPPESLLGQLREGGRLVGVSGSGPAGKATIWRMGGGRATSQPLFDAAAPLLPGFAKRPEFVF